MLSAQEVCLLCGVIIDGVEGGLYSPHHFKYAQSGLLTHSPTVHNYTLSGKRVTLELNSYFSCHNCFVAYLARKFLQSLKPRCFARTYAFPQCITQKINYLIVLLDRYMEMHTFAKCILVIANQIHIQEYLERNLIQFILQ